MVVVVALLCPPGGSRAPVKGFGQATLRLREADNSWTDKGQLLLYACAVMHGIACTEPQDADCGMWNVS